MAEHMNPQRNKMEQRNQHSLPQSNSAQVGTEVPPIGYEVPQTLGQPLEAETREFTGPRFGHNFSQVRVHTDRPASNSAQAVNTPAYTVGRAAVFGAGQYMPNTSTGRWLLAPQLTHTMRDRSSPQEASAEMGQGGTQSEQEADRIADRGVHSPQFADGSRLSAWSAHPPAGLPNLPLPLQAKLYINAPGDAYEEEADRVAEQIMRMPDLGVGAHLRPWASEGVGGLNGKSAVALHGPVAQAEHRTGAARLQRQDGGVPAPSSQQTVPSPQQIYDAAVALLQSRHSLMHSILSQGRIGQTVRVQTIHSPISGGAPGSPTAVDFFFDLEVILGGVVQGAAAQFLDVPEIISGMQSPTATVLLPLRMNVNPPAGPNAASQLAERLFHEGIHMLLRRDRLLSRYLPPGAQSGTLVSFNAFKQLATRSQSFPILRVELDAEITLFFVGRSRQPPVPTRQLADEVIERVIEEKFAIDRQRSQFPGTPVSNLTIANEYIVLYLIQEGVAAPRSSRSIQRIIQLMSTVLDDAQTLSQQTPAVPAPPTAAVPSGAPAPSGAAPAPAPSGSAAPNPRP